MKASTVIGLGAAVAAVVWWAKSSAAPKIHPDDVGIVPSPYGPLPGEPAADATTPGTAQEAGE